MANIIQGILFIICLAYGAIGYYRRQAGYRLVGGECLQWRYLARQLAHGESFDKTSGILKRQSNASPLTQSMLRGLVQGMSSLERKANANETDTVAQLLSLFALHVLDVLIGLSVKVFLVCYAITRWVCSVELYSFDESRTQRWQGMNYYEFRQKAARRYKIVYIRHGESMWNKLFNRGLSLGGLERFVTGVFEEILKATEVDSQILDSPLSAQGVEQASELSAWVLGSSSHFTDAYTDNCCFLTSNLRRAIGTVLIGFGKRVSDRNSVRVLSCLQELTRNPDSISYAFAHNTTPLDLFGTPEVPDEIVSVAKSKLSWIDHKGNRGLFDRIEDRFEELLAYCDRVYDKENVKIFVISGHSLYLKKLLQFYLPVRQAGAGAPNLLLHLFSRTVMSRGHLAKSVIAGFCSSTC